MHTTSVIVPAWNGAPLIVDCLRSIAPQLGASDELIVVDNGSTDGTPDLIGRDFPAVRLIRLARNLGFAGGVNRGLEIARGNVLILINQDVTLNEGCLDALRARLIQSGPGIAGGKLLYPDGKTIQHAGGVIVYPRAEADHHGYRQIDDGRWDAMRDVGYVTGALFAFDRRVLQAIGSFDEGYYPAYYEEVDYCFRARGAGFAVMYDPAAVAVHHESVSLESGENPLRRRAMERGRLRFVLCRYSPDRVWRDFFPAERAYAASAPPVVRDVLSAAYWATLLSLPAHPQPLDLPPEEERKYWLDVAVFLSEQIEAALQPHREDDRAAAPAEPLHLPELREHDFHSDAPVVGPLIGWVRRAVYSLTARWGVLSLIQQQASINRMIAAHLFDCEARLQEYELRLSEQKRDLIQVSRTLAGWEIQQRYLERK